MPYSYMPAATCFLARVDGQPAGGRVVATHGVAALFAIFQDGKLIGATHSGTSQAIASFTGGANGDTRSGFLYVDRATTLSGFCQRTLTRGGFSVAFRQNCDPTYIRDGTT